MTFIKDEYFCSAHSALLTGDSFCYSNGFSFLTFRSRCFSFYLYFQLGRFLVLIMSLSFLKKNRIGRHVKIALNEKYLNFYSRH
jgi:hypothetical protein